MSFPNLLPKLPPPGQKLRLPTLAGSADALALAQAGERLAQERRMLVVIAADAQEAERLAAEIQVFAPDLKLQLLPDWETLPYDQFSPHQDLVSARLAALYAVSARQNQVLVVPATTALYRLPPPAYLAAYTFLLQQGQNLDVEALRAQLVLAGYAHVTQVVSPGEFSVRGGLIDLFPMGSVLPYRIELFDAEIETLRTFDVDTQRTVYPVREIRLLPAREFPLDEAARTLFRQRFRETFEGDPSKSTIYRDVSNGLAPGGIEYYLPLFFAATATLPDYLPDDAVVALHGPIEEALAAFWSDTEGRYRLLRGDRARPLLPPLEIFLAPDALLAACKRWSRLLLAGPGAPPSTLTGPVPDVRVDRRAENPLQALRQLVESNQEPIWVCAETLGRRETMAQYFAEYGLRPALFESLAELLAAAPLFALVSAPLGRGFRLAKPGLTLITENELYAEGPRRKSRRDAARKSNVEAMLRDLSEIRIGDPVVHQQHGVGRYQGLVTLDLGDGSNEFLHLAYANEAQLYVPVANLHLIGRYSGAAPEAAPLHTLGSPQWEKARRKAAQQARDTAAELLHLYAQRAARQGHAFKLVPHDYEAFAEGFGFEETPDQAEAIRAVLADLSSGKPMDRLVCGDVGFGKTEVALRAAFVALMDGKQVAVLVPTTLLAEQHFQTFSDRFSDLPVKLAELSRFRSGKEIKQALAGLAEGGIDLVIGTHKLIQSDVKFKRLGLVIIDEEHRFGVRQKEALKKLRAEVDVLTLTATPIPRTLAMSLEGLRDFSVIATAPQKRLAIKTFVSHDSAGTIREAALRELKRGGQIYFLHNEIDTIESMRERLAGLVPEARIAVAHGQMPERELEQVMRNFYQQRSNLLLCSTIIETGIDVPSANTIIIQRADRFGLAQLHQLRGRVGRSHHQAYAYLLTPPEEALSAQAKKRLEAIQMMEDLGSGFYLAMHDLEIRGAGEVLGDQQSGEMQEVGFQLYNELLSAAVRALRSGQEPDLSGPLAVTTEIKLHSPALLPEAYCSDVHERLVLYKRLANCEREEDLAAMQEELIDRFGLPPEATRTLLACHRLRIVSRDLGVLKIDATPQRLLVQFVAKPAFEPMKLIRRLQEDRRYQLAGPEKLRIEQPTQSAEERATLLEALFRDLR
ncbi:MAG: transcription-repair coupling factor [Betaproteobacteria bacterium]|nr:transcription-repair coupling factor [Betaproteobacteria bacterium]